MSQPFKWKKGASEFSVMLLVRILEGYPGKVNSFERKHIHNAKCKRFVHIDLNESTWLREDSVAENYRKLILFVD